MTSHFIKKAIFRLKCETFTLDILQIETVKMLDSLCTCGETPLEQEYISPCQDDGAKCFYVMENVIMEAISVYKDTTFTLEIFQIDTV